MNLRNIQTRSRMQCQQCDSNDTTTFEMVHLSGSQSARISGTVYGFDGDVEWHSGTIRTQTHLAQIAAPPIQPKFWSLMMWLGFVVTILVTVITFAALQIFNYNHPSLSGISPFGKDPFKHIDYFHIADLPYMFAPAIFIVGLITSTKLRNPSYKRERLAYQNQLASWHNSVICLRCGNTWLL